MKIFLSIFIFVNTLTLTTEGLLFSAKAAESEIAIVRPREYPKALRNPLKGFVANHPHPFATLSKTYIKWSDLENKESDGIEKIRRYCNKIWKDYPKRNMKAIPRVRLYMPNDNGEGAYAWPSDMIKGDYSSLQFKKRVFRLVKKLAECWDNDPRVAFVEMGIIGWWGEQHHPSVTKEMEQVLGDVFTDAFKHKLVMIRNPKDFRDYSFGVHWDSWAHNDQMNSEATGGQGIAGLGDRWKIAVIGGETAYDWGNHDIQPGSNPDDTLTEPGHLDFLIDSIRQLHCNHLGWIADYNKEDPLAKKGAEEVQKALGYRFVIHEVRYPLMVQMHEEFEVSFTVVNIGSSPFYYNWPVEISLLNPETREVAWRSTFKNLDIRRWLPGDKWAANYDNSAEKHKKYGSAPQTYAAKDRFKLSKKIKQGEYILALSILDPAGMLPSARFAIENYFNGGRHPIGRIGVGRHIKEKGLNPHIFDDPEKDTTLHYIIDSK